MSAVTADREAAIRETAERRGARRNSDGSLSHEMPSWADVTGLLAELAAAREREATALRMLKAAEALIEREAKMREALNLALMHLEDERAIAAVRALSEGEGQ